MSRGQYGGGCQKSDENDVKKGYEREMQKARSMG